MNRYQFIFGCRTQKILLYSICCMVLAAGFVVPQTGSALTASDQNSTTAQDLVDSLLGDSSTSVSNVVYTGASEAGGVFSEGGTGGLDIEQGIILSSGDIAFAADNVNDSENSNLQHFTPGDTDLDTLVALPTNDAAVLEFDFIPVTDVLSFKYIFASEEYNEFVGTSFNDVFGFFLDGVNIALVPNSNDIVSINSINNGRNADFYRDNTGATFSIEYDGFTAILLIEVNVTPGATHHMKLAIADTADWNYDSAIFISGFTTIRQVNLDVSVTGSGSVTSEPAGIDCGAACTAAYDENTAVTLTAVADAGWKFDAWSGDADCVDGSVTLDEDKQCVAVFLKANNLDVSVTGSGSVTSEPAGIDCGTACTATYAENTVITLTTASNTAEWRFDAWSGDADCADGSITLDADKQCVAAFFEVKTQAIVFDALPDKTYGDADFGVTAVADSGLPVSFAAAGQCSMADAATVHLSGAGSCTVTASQAGDNEWGAAPDVAQSFNIAKAIPAVVWEDPADIVYGTQLSDVQLNASANAEGIFTYTPSSGAILDAGDAQTLTADFILAADAFANYNTPDSATVQINVKKISTATLITSDALDPSILGDNVTVSFSVTPASGSNPTGEVSISGGGGTCSYALTSGDAGIGSCVLALNAAGSHTLIAVYIGDEHFSGSTSEGEMHQVDLLCEPNAIGTGVTLLGDTNISTSACFTNHVSSANGQSGNGLIAAQDERVDLSVDIVVDPLHRGQAAEAVIWIKYQHRNESLTSMRNGDSWQTWDKAWTSLEAVNEIPELGAELSVDIFHDILNLPGEFTVHAGYRLMDGTLIYNGLLPINFFVANSTGDGEPQTYFELEIDTGGACQSAVIQHIQQTETLDIQATIHIDPQHVGAVADMLMAAARQQPGMPMQYSQDWVNWMDLDALLNALVPREAGVTLASSMSMQVHQGPFQGEAGEYMVYLGYRLSDGKLVYNNIDLLNLLRANGLSVDPQSANQSETCAYFAGAVATETGVQGADAVIAQENDLIIQAAVHPDPVHIGEIGDLLMISVYRRQGSDREYIFYSQDWLNWNTEFPAPLNAVETGVMLTESVPLQFQSPVETAPGTYTVYLAYRLQDGTVVYNGLDFLEIEVH
ncbi:MAG: Ig-like domain repeat protein [Gammaproteobacteria bacterium]|nr:Ig-like domain repeat protein [Gammaproteobacteria bacterium]